MYRLFFYTTLIASLSISGTVKKCCNSRQNVDNLAFSVSKHDSIIASYSIDTTVSVIHVLVALCDNTYQGIVPVPSKIGDGSKPAANLYWGCGYGISSFFKYKSQEWNYIGKLPLSDSEKKDSIILQRIIFKHKSLKFYLIADAYQGKYIEKCTRDFLFSLSGKMNDTVHLKDRILGINGHSKLLAYIGHNGLMDFEFNDSLKNMDGKKRDCIILACRSKSYFSPLVKSAAANPLVWTTGLMCPEAYTLHDALSSYVRKGNADAVRKAAYEAYAKYQKCGVNAASRLLVTGF